MKKKNESYVGPGYTTHFVGSDPQVITIKLFPRTKLEDRAKEIMELIIRRAGPIRSCKCHKIVALTFFEKGDDGEYRNVPLIPGEEKTRYFTVGQVAMLTHTPEEW